MYRNLLVVSVGSIIAGHLRYFLQTLFPRLIAFPIPLRTLPIKISGCFFIGIIVGLSQKDNLPSPQTGLFPITDIYQGYTTFSSFAIKKVLLLRDTERLYRSLYWIFTVAGGILMAYLSSFLFKSS